LQVAVAEKNGINGKFIPYISLETIRRKSRETNSKVIRTIIGLIDGVRHEVQ